MGLVEFLAVLIPSAAIGVVWSLLFCCMRKKKPEIYRPKDLMRKREKIPGLSDSFFGWLPDLMRIKEYDVLEHSGLDAVVYLRTLKMGFQIFVFSGIYCFIILLPVYATAENHSEDDLNLISMANIANGSPRLWASFFGVYITTGIVCYLIYKNYSELAEMAVEHRKENRVENYSVMVSELPDDMQDPKILKDYFSEYPGDLGSVVLSEKVSELMKKAKDYKKLIKKLKKVKKKVDEGETPMHKVSLCGEKVDSLDQYSTELQALQEEIEELQKVERDVGDIGSVSDVGTVAFVTFNSMEAASQCVSEPARYNAGWKDKIFYYKIEKAREPKDIRWQALHVKHKVQFIGTLLVNIFMTLLVIFYSLPIAFLSSIMNLANLTEALPFLRPILDLSGAVQGIIQGLLPTLAMIIFMAILPIIILMLYGFQYPKSQSHLELLCFRRYYLCLVWMVFLVTTIAGSVLASVNGILEMAQSNPMDIVDLLGRSLPQQGSFFMGYVALAALGSQTMELSRLVPLILSYILGVSWDQDSLPRIEYRLQLPKHLNILTISIAYTVLSPFMLIWSIVYFAIAYVVWKHQMLYVYFEKYETGGRYWPDIVNRIVTATIIFQLTTIGSLGLKNAGVQPPLLIPSILILLYVRKIAHQKFRQSFVNVWARDSKTFDNERDGVQFEEDAYRAPMLKHNYLTEISEDIQRSDEAIELVDVETKKYLEEKEEKDGDEDSEKRKEDVAVDVEDTSKDESQEKPLINEDHEAGVDSNSPRVTQEDGDPAIGDSDGDV